MLKQRAKGASTDAISREISSFLKDERTERVLFFATPTEPSQDFTEAGGMATNLPGLVVLCEGRILGPVTMQVIYDQPNGLSAGRGPRLGEVKDLLKHAIQSEKGFFADTRAPFTSHLPPDEAIDMLLKLAVEPLTLESRERFQGLLQPLAEAWR